MLLFFHRNEYYYDTLVYEGTKYGETSQFPIIGYTITHIDEDIAIYKWGYKYII